MRFDFSKFDPNYQGGPCRLGRLMVIPITGRISFGDNRSWCGGEGGAMPHSTITSAVQQTAEDDSIDAVAMHVHSDGGDAFAFPDIDHAMGALVDSGKDTFAIVHAAALSLAYGAICRVGTIYCSPVGVVGSIGGRTPTIMDYSESMRKAGIDFFTAKTGELKDFGSGTSGIPESGRRMYEEMCRLQTAPFFAAVCEGRKIPLARLTGMEAAMFVGPAAREMGLVDVVEPTDTTITELVRRFAGTRSQTRGYTMPTAPKFTIDDVRNNADLMAQLTSDILEQHRSNQPAPTPTPTPATFAQLDARFGADPAFVQECQRKALTMELASEAFTTKLQASLDELAKKCAALEARATPTSGTPAVPPIKGSAGVDTSGSSVSSTAGDFGALCAKFAHANPDKNVGQVMLAVRKTNPDAYVAWNKAGRSIDARGFPV